MSKTVKKSANLLATGVAWATGFILGLVLFGVLYAWYLTGFSDSTSVLTTAVLLVIVIAVIWYMILVLTKKNHADTYAKAIWFGVGMFIALLIAGFILSYFNLTAGLSVSTLVYAIRSKGSDLTLPMCGYAKNGD